MADTELSIAVGPPSKSIGTSHLQLWQDQVHARPNAPALIAKHQKPGDFKWVGSHYIDHDYVQWSYSDLDRGARRLATALNRLTHIERRPIVTLVNTQAEWALFFWAAAYLHSPLVPINPKVATRSQEISHMLAMTQPAVVVCADSVLAGQLEQSLSEEAMAAIPVKLLTSHSTGEGRPGWDLLSDVMSGDRTPPDTPDVIEAKDTCMVLFTSGTTSLPKPCNVESGHMVNAGLGYMESRHITSGHKLVQHLPNFHSYGIAWSLCFWYAGGIVVLPSEAFEAQASLECFDMFKTTHMSLVPTTAQAMLAHPYFAQADLSTLVSVDVSGAGVLPSTIDACVSGLKVPSYVSYGMTESPGTLIWPDDRQSVVRDGEVMSGKCTRGTTVKVCEPGTRNLVPRGAVGELHNGGLQVIHGYASGVSPEAFYVDEDGTQWIVTGDQAVMDPDGAVRISGRYKDMIIRGGENISPASIEDYLRRCDGVASAEVIGVPDEMAGEVPIAIITLKDGWTVNASDLKQLTSRDLGPAFAPKIVLQLTKDLGMDDFPKTASGKVRKVELRQIVRDYLKKLQQQDRGVDRSAPTVDSLIKIWQKISGADALKPECGLETFADSLMMMQLSSMVKKQLGRDVTVEAFKNCDTIQQQADLIDSRPDISVKVVTRPMRQGPLTLADMPHLEGSTAAFKWTKALVSVTMSKVGLGWNDVEDVMPLPDWDAIFCHRSRSTSWNLRFTWHAPVSRHELEAAVMESLKCHPTLRSMGVEDREGRMLLVNVRHSEKWLGAAMTSGHEVEKKEDLNTLLLDHPELDCATIPGPLVRIHFASVTSDGTSGLVFVGSHATNDMSMTKLWLDDVSALLEGRSTPVPHALFKDYATAFHQHRQGVEADNGVAYWTAKHAGISSVPESTLWPPQRAAEWFKGVDTNWQRWDGAKARRRERCVSQSEKRAAQKGVRRIVKVQDIARLKSEHSIPVFMLVKAAIAIMNIAQAGGKEAIFGTINAARSWPFQSDYSALDRETYAGNPLDISGCTTEYVLDRIPVAQVRNVVEFMQFVTKDEEANSAYAHTPFFRVVDAMRDPLSSEDCRTFAERDRDAEALLPLIRRQSFNWLPTAPVTQAEGKGLSMLEMLTRMDNGLTITGFLANDKKSVCLSFSWDAEHMSVPEANRALDRLAGLVDAMGKADNWDATVGELLRL